MKHYPLIAKVRRRGKSLYVLLDKRTLKALDFKSGRRVYLKKKRDDLLLFTETMHHNRMIKKAPESWDDFFEALSRLKDLDGFLSAREREQPTQERDPFDE
jgi:antitoxin component of MazEF toxin-antitoxin module